MAMHPNRNWNIKTYTDLDEMCRDITRMTWTLCSGFRWGDITLVNDSFSEDSLQEYAMCVDDVQVDSITTSWCKPDKLAELIRGAKEDQRPTYGKVDFGGHPDGECDHCA